jgi:hypothetical protein
MQVNAQFEVAVTLRGAAQCVQQELARPRPPLGPRLQCQSGGERECQSERGLERDAHTGTATHTQTQGADAEAEQGTTRARTAGH